MKGLLLRLNGRIIPLDLHQKRVIVRLSRLLKDRLVFFFSMAHQSPESEVSDAFLDRYLRFALTVKINAVAEVNLLLQGILAFVELYLRT